MTASRFALLVWVLVAMMRTGCAETIGEITNPKRANNTWVSDMAHVLTADTERRINNTINQLERKNGAEMAVVTIRRTDGSSAKNFATRLFNTWGIGKRGRDNGVLVLLVMEERRIEVETGSGLSRILPDSQVQDILQTRVIPRFKEDDYNGGVWAGVQSLAQSLASPANSTAQIAPGTTGNSAPQRNFSPQHNFSPTPAAPPAPPAFAPLPDSSSARGSSSRSSSGGLLPLVAGFLLVPLGGWAFYRSKLRHCPQCKQQMRRLTESEDDEILQYHQQFEEQLGSVDYRVWRCDLCRTTTAERAVKWLSGYGECPKCSHVTLGSQTTILRHPTYTETGESLITRTCRFPNCNHSEQEHRILPVKPRPAPQQTHTHSSHRSSLGGSSWSSNSSSRSRSSSNSSSRNSGNFGGGSSSGGGAGASW